VPPVSASRGNRGSEKTQPLRVLGKKRKSEHRVSRRRKKGGKVEKPKKEGGLKGGLPRGRFSKGEEEGALITS